MDTATARAARAAPVLSLLFLVSGATALAGQVVLNRLLTYVFGASHQATSTVLAAYMGGLALGSLAAGRLAARLRRPVLWYGSLELGVGAFFALLPALYPALQSAGTTLGRALGAQPFGATAVRFALSFVFVVAPTALMGATLPVLLSAFQDDPALRRRLPFLYACNTLGGAAGALVSGYFLLYAWGLDGTARACAAGDLAIGAAAIAIALWSAPDTARKPPAPGAAGVAAAWTLPPAAVCGLAFAQGALSFSLEVTWSHLVRTVIGVTTYAFTVMLTLILLGIGLGSLALSGRHRRDSPPLARFVLAQLFLSAALAASLFAWDRFPDFVSLLLRRRYEWSFAAREVMRFAFAVPLLLPAGVALGVSLPALTASVTPGRGDRQGGTWVGRVFGYNTLGAIFGSLCTGFALLGRIRSERLIEGAVLGSLALAAAPWVLGAQPRRWPRRAEAALAACAVAVLVAFPGWDLQRLTSGKHFTWDFYSPGPPDSLVFVREDAQSGFVTVERAREGPRQLLTMKTNGKYEGTDAEAEFQDNFALMGALYLRRFDGAALLGLGPGRTLALLHEMGFRRIEVMEFSPAIVAAAQAEFGPVSGEALADRARVRVVLDDGRQHLQLSTATYDYVVVAGSGAAFAGAGALYNRDFFEVVRARLAPAGVFLLWIQIHHLFPSDVRSVTFSLRSVFPHVQLYAAHGQGFLIASEAPLRIDRTTAERVGSGRRAALVLRARKLDSPLDLVRWNVFSREADLQRYFASPLVSGAPELYTDMRPRFEFTAPMGLATRILGLGYDFAPLASSELPDCLPPLPDTEAERLRKARDEALGRTAAQRRPAAATAARHSAASSAAY